LEKTRVVLDNLGALTCPNVEDNDVAEQAVFVINSAHATKDDSLGLVKCDNAREPSRHELCLVLLNDLPDGSAV